MWRAAAGQQSAATRLYELIDGDAGEEALRELVADRDRKRGKYFFDEAEINDQGYRFLRDGKLDKAIRLLRLNVGLYPAAWNVYDSLGEALAEAGHTAEAVRTYEKSLALNPESPSGQAALARLKGVASPR